jgi:hypothetical protein
VAEAVETPGKGSGCCSNKTKKASGVGLIPSFKNTIFKKIITEIECKVYEKKLVGR